VDFAFSFLRGTRHGNRHNEKLKDWRLISLLFYEKKSASARCKI